jgi:parvulin-like peptidyl-prolyl isomerase
MKRFFLFFPVLAVFLPLAALAADDGNVPEAVPGQTEAAVTAASEGIEAPQAEKTGQETLETTEKQENTAETEAEPAENGENPPENAENGPEMAENPVETAEDATGEPVESAENVKPEAETPEEPAVPAPPAPVGPRLEKAATRTLPAGEPFEVLASRASLEKLIRRDSVLLDSYAAVVGKKIITVGDVFNLCQARLQRLASSPDRAAIRQEAQDIFDRARDSLIADELVLLAFADAGGTLPDRAIEDHISEVLQTRFGGDREKLFSALASARLSMDDWRRKMTDQLAIQVMRQKEITARVLVTPGDVRAAYEADKAQYTHSERVHIRMLSIPRGTTMEEVAASRRLAQRIRERILSGVADFPRAARLLSHATGAGENAGDAGWHDVADLMPGVAEAVEKLSPGEISPVLEVPPFLYLVQLEERKEPSVDAFEDVADDIESKLKAAQYDKLEKTWLDTLKGKYFVQTYRHELF